jgi:hypothetical protein
MTDRYIDRATYKKITDIDLITLILYTSLSLDIHNSSTSTKETEQHYPQVNFDAVNILKNQI